MGRGSAKPTGLQLGKIQNYSLYFRKLKLHIHFYTCTFTSWNTSAFTYFKKRLDNYTLFLFSSICFPHFLFSLTLTLQFPYVLLPPLSCSVCSSFHILPFTSPFFTFFYLLHLSPFGEVPIRLTSPALKTVIASFSLFLHAFTPRSELAS